MAKISTKKRSILYRPPYVFIWLAVIIVGAYFLGRATIFKPAAKAARTGSSYTKGQPSNAGGSSSSGNQQSSGSSSNSGSQKTGSSGSGGTSAVLIAPSGSFVSNHHPNLSGSPAPNTVTSVCNTTPGASCQITFTMDSVTKSLPSQTADSGGSTYWTNWKLQGVGLTAGSWKVTATATLNGQTKTASDAMSLVVSE
jgi:hypothetical protein